jgi:hypothetical protein
MALSVVVILVGVLIRLIPLYRMGFTQDVPLGNGGLYVLFAEEILGAGYALPSIIPYYTAGGVPYAYPPLAFYLLALLFDFTSLTKFALMNFVPVICSCLSLLAFYRLVRQLVNQYRLVVASVLIYGLLPAAFLEHLSGEGLVEAFGTVTFILAVTAMLRLNIKDDLKSAVVLGLLIALNVLTSPGTTYGTLVSIVVLWALGYPDRRCKLHRLIVVFGIGVAASAPYWLTVASHHGLAIFLRTFARQHSAQDILNKLSLDVTGEPFLTLWGVLALLGVLYCVHSRNWGLPVWCGVVYAIPREFQYMMAVPLSILAAYGLFGVAVPKTGLAPSNTGGDRRGLWRRLGPIALVLPVTFAYGVWSAVLVAVRLPVVEQRVTQSELDMMTWIQQHTDEDSAFLVIGNEIEWFPEITERITLNVTQGSEWAETDEVYRLGHDLASCVVPECYLETMDDYNVFPDYVYLSESPENGTLVQLFGCNGRFVAVRENDGAILFAVVD